MPEKWEPLLNNLGHTMRKMKRYEQALEFHRQAMVLSPQNSTTYVAIGFVYSLMFKWHEAIENFHKALGLKREDTFTNSMINLAMDHLINCITPLSDPPPPYGTIDQQRGNKSHAVVLSNDVDMDVSGE
jgi:anaphase-promoting complex subunit 6